MVVGIDVFDMVIEEVSWLGFGFWGWFWCGKNNGKDGQQYNL
jgi:hypothetical protein